MKFALAIAIMLGASVSARAEDISVSVADPRAFGYFLGDVVKREIMVETRGGTQLKVAALPRPGPQQYWLDLVDVRHETKAAGSGTLHHLTLSYQIFYSALEPKRVTIPKTTLFFSAPESGAATTPPPPQVTRVVPALEVIVSPLREIIQSSPGAPADQAKPDESPLRADAVAMPVVTGGVRSRLLAAGLLLLSVLTGLAYQYALWPFGKRAERPFTRAERAIARLSGSSDDMLTYEQQLRILHRAFDEAAGNRVLTQDIPRFLSAHTEYREFEQRVRTFFGASSLAFFGGNTDAAYSILPRDDLADFARDMAREERRSA